MKARRVDGRGRSLAARLLDMAPYPLPPYTLDVLLDDQSGHVEACREFDAADAAFRGWLADVTGAQGDDLEAIYRQVRAEDDRRAAGGG